MHCEDTNPVETPSLWALEPAVTPMPAGWAVALGLALAVALVSLASGTTPATDVEDWHGNVAASQSLEDR